MRHLFQATAVVFAAVLALPVTAAPLNLVQDPAGSGLYTALITDAFDAIGVANADDWSFEGEAGDRVTVRLEAAVGNARPRIRLLNTGNTVLQSNDGGTDGVGTFYAYVIPTPGTYRVRAYTDHQVSGYALRVEVARGLDLEVENNDTPATATVLTPAVGAGSFAFAVGGLAPAGDSADTFALGLVPAGANLQITAQLPSSSLAPADVTLRLLERRSADRSLDFNGSTYAAIPHNPVFDAIETANTMTIEAWVYIRSWPQGYFAILDKYKQAGDWGWAFTIENGGGGISFWSGNNLRASANITPSVNVWHHVAMAYDHGANVVRFYLNGDLVATRTSPGVLTNTDTDPAYIGYGPSGATNEFNNGMISEVRLWNRALTTEEIQTNYAAAGLNGVESGLVGLWRLDEGSGTVTTDTTASANHAVLGNGDPARVPAWGTGAIRPVASGSTSVNRAFPAEAQAWVQLAATANRGISARYLLSGSLTDSAHLQLLSTSLPASGGITTAYTQWVNLVFDDELNAASANNVANYELRGAGSDGTFGTADDFVYTFASPNYANGTTLTLPLSNGPLQPGLNRFTIGLGLRDRAGNSLAATYTHEFTSEPLGLFKIESQDNNTFATATNLDPLVADGGGFIIGARGNISHTADLDYYRFSATAGDRIFINSENVGHGASTGLIFRVYGPNQAEITSIATSNGTGQLQLVAATTGTYYVRAQHHNTYSGEYRLAISLRAGTFSLENETNNTLATANALTWTTNGAVRSTEIAGVLNYGDPADWFGLGFLDVGTGLTISASKGSAGELVWILDVMDGAGNTVISGTVGAANIAYTVPSGKAGNYFARIRPSSGADLFGRYQLTAALGDTTPPAITADTLPTEGATVTNFFGEFQLTFSENLQAGTVNDSSNYALRSAGPDGVFNTADDETYTVVVASNYTSGLSASYRLSDGPVQPGLHRFEAKTGIQDLYGNGLAAVYVRQFTIAGVPGWTYETRSNESFATATSLEPLASDGSGRLGKARGSLSHNSDLDYFSFTATAQDRVLVTTENVGNQAATGLYYRIYGPNQSEITSFGTSNGTGQVQFVAATTGTYYVRVQHHNTYRGEYRIAVATRPGSFGFEGEGNDNLANANTLTWTQAEGGPRTASVGAVLNLGDPADWFALGFLDAGSGITVNATKPPSSEVVWILDVLTTGSTVVASAEIGAPSLNYVVPAGKAGNYYARIRPSSGAGMFAQYQLTLTLADTDNPVITSDTLPAEGSTVTDFFGDFQLTFSENLLASTVNNASNYDLRAVGADGLFGTADDETYTVALVTAYTTGLNARYRVTDGPLQPGLYRLQVKTGLQDLYGNPLSSVYTRTFTISGVAGYVLESRSNETFATATSLGALAPDGAGLLGRARGQISTTTDLDYFSFTANANDRVIITTENAGRGAGTGLYYRVYGPSQAEVTTLTAGNGSAQGGFIAAAGGTYYIRVQHHNTFNGEYRIAVAVFPGSFVLEDEDNDSASMADSLTWNQMPGMQAVDVAGVLNYGDSADWFRLGSLAEGTRITLGATKPPSSDLAWLLDIVNAGGTAVASGSANASPVTHTIPVGASGVYYARIRPSGTGSMLAQYRLALSLSDTDAPRVTADTLPGEGATDVTLFSRFTLTFSEDMDAATVNSLANYELRAAGPDEVFDTADDISQPLVLTAPYTSGLTVTLRTASNGPLAVGSYRFRALPGLLDKTGNALSPVYVRSFAIGQLPGYTYETEPNGTRDSGTLLPIESTQSGLAGAGGRGYLFSSSDVDFWRFDLVAGDRLLVLGETLGSPVNSNLNYQVVNPAGTSIATVVAENTGSFSFPLLTAGSAGTYALRVAVHNGYTGEYRFRVYVMRGDMQVEAEPNNTIAAASPMTLVASGENLGGSLAGVARVTGDLDYLSLGNLQAGTTVFLSTRQPTHSPFAPVVSLYNASGALLSEANGGRAGDGVAQVPITATGAYFALVRTSGVTHGLASEYILDVLVVPSVGLSFPNLQVTSLTPPPATGLKSGDATTVSFRVDNVGNLATAAVTWVDRVVLSTDQVYGNADDLEIGVVSRTGPLAATSHYTAQNVPVRIPDGINGNYYIIVRTDHTNTVTEFVLEGDNETVSEAPITITRANYPDLVVESLTVSAADASGVRNANWIIANRGAGVAAGGHAERFIVRNTTSGQTVSNVLTPIETPLASNGMLARTLSFTATAAGHYVVEVIADAQSQRYEYNEAGHEAAEDNNVATALFSITQLHTLTVQADPAAGGTVTGGGTFPAGSERTVSAAPHTPYVFTGWYEGALLRSVDPVYVTTLSSDRVLTARFAYPTVVITTQVSPAGTGVVTGGGSYSVGSDVTLQANPLPGYAFDHWSEGAINVGTIASWTFVAEVNRTLRANFVEANPTHLVSTATSPAGIAVVAGAGTYANGQTAVITAPATVTSGETEYVFVRFLVNGVPASTSRSISKTFTTQDAPELTYVAEYAPQGVKPSVMQVTSNLGNRVGLTSNFQLTARFDRAMDHAVKPVLELVSANATTIPSVPVNGAWTSANTYVAPAVTIGTTHGGDYQVRISAARDTQNRVMDPIALYPFTVDVTAPTLPVLAKGVVTASSTAVEWAGYDAPADLASFRVYRSASSFTSLEGLSPIGSLPASARTYTFTGLTIDTDYHVAIVPVDTVGNAVPSVTSFLIRVTSDLPPAVAFEVSALSTTAARVTWTFDAAEVIGFKGFKIYRQPSAFTSIEGLTPFATLGDAVRSFEDLGLDRTQPYHYTVVAYNNLGESITSVVSKPWKDPLSGTLTTDFTVTDPLLVITQPLTIAEGATLTVPAGTVVAFAPGAGLTVASGRIVADGTVFAPVVFTSLADVEQASPSRGSWTGITLADPARPSTLRNVWVKYGMGLAITAGNHTVDTLGAAWNELSGLQLTGTVSLQTQAAYLVNNAVGATVEDGASLTITGSVLKNNDRNAAIVGSGTLQATGNWWGTADAAAIAATLVGPVAAGNPLADEPILTRSLRSADGTISTGSASPVMSFASLNAMSYRVSEDSSFAGALFVDVPRNPLSTDLFNTASWQVPVPLSAGAGLKTLYAQFRSPTGAVSEPVSFSVEYVTSGPMISTFSLAEAQSVHRPIVVTATAASALPIASLTLTADEVVIGTSSTASLAAAWDVRALAPGVHRVRIAAVDTAGNLATRTVNVVVSPNPPPAPVITSPAGGTSTTANQITVSGTAEPLAAIRIHRNGAVVATTAADANGAFTAVNVPLVEGANGLAAVAFDAIGTTPSPLVSVYVDSGPPAAVTLLPIEYNTGQGIFVDWDLPTSGEIPVAFRVYWHDQPFSSAAEATGSSGLLSNTHALLTKLGDGLYHFAVVGYDAAGNASALSNLRSFQVDLTPPSFTIAYNQAMPVGPGTLGITVTASEALESAPLLLMRPEGGALLSVTLTAAGGNTYTASFPVTNLSARTGTAGVGITGKDLAGNAFTGAPSGPALVFDLTRPTGVVTTSLPSPIQTTSNVTLSVNLTLSELPKAGTSPTLSFSPPDGAQVPIALAGSGLDWVGTLTLTPAMGDGHGTFLLSVEDQVGNVGTVLTSGDRIELYTTNVPTPPGVPATFTVQPLKGGYIRLTWSAVDKAHSYRLYREPGASAAVPTTLITEGITALTIDDLPPADGPYRYVVTAYRLGAEGQPSGVRATTSDRTPPPAPTATTAALGASKIKVEWTPATGDAAAKWIVYRNDVAIATINNPEATSFSDAPPRGVMTYAVAAVDALGNEARGPNATLELQVGAVSNLVATVDPEVGTTLTWTSTDATATGFNVYRNGTKQNVAPIPSSSFTDTFNGNGEPVTYLVTALNVSGQESTARSVLVQPLTASIRLNPADDGDLISVARYFDTYRITYTVGPVASQPLALAQGEVIRAVAGEVPVQVSFPLAASTAAGETKTVDVVVPAPDVTGVVQGASITLQSEPEAGGSLVRYRFIQDFDPAQAPSLMMTVTADSAPLAGGLTDFKVRVYNRGHAPIDLVLSRGGNTQPGELEMLVLSQDGVLVSSVPFSGTVPGAIVNAKGEAFLRVESGDYVVVPFKNVLVPEGVGGQTLTFRARFNTIYHAVGSAWQRASGPLEGTMASSASVTPYYATAQTTQPAYSDDQPVVIFGQALSRETGLPVPNVKVRVGLRVRGAVLRFDVFTNDAGAYEYAYTPSIGLAGEIAIWAAHPDIVDQLDQARVSFFRLFTKPGRIEAIMSKNDKLDFEVALLNPGDLTLTGASVSFRAYRVADGVEVDVPGLTGTARTLPATVAPRSEPKLGLRLQATLDVPDDARFEFTIGTAQGASTKLTGTVSFRPALAVLSTVSPTNGYAEAGVGRGQLKSVEVTVQNRGLRDLTGVKLIAPASVPWIHVNLAPDANGQYPLADIPVGGTRNFSVVFAPPADTPVGFYNDFLLIKGENSTGDYRLNLFATVTSQEKGAVQFDVTNLFGNPVPNASVWLRNPTLGIEVGPVLTDVNGHALVPNLMEGEWQWKTQAAGHGGTQGMVSVIPDQTVGVETELTVSMVTVKFSVVPVPFTDYYEIKIEQTFQTRTPIPNLVMSPPHQTLSVEAGWSGTLMYTLRNEGLRSIFDVKLNGGTLPTMRATPMVSFIPELKAQETIEIPVFFEYFGPAESTSEGASMASAMRAMADEADGGGELALMPTMAADTDGARSFSGGVSAMNLGPAGEILDCFKEFKYGTISFKAEGGISSISNKPYTVGANATIDVDELLALLCNCPGTSGIGGAICGSIVRKVTISKVTKTLDVICLASTLIKAITCAAAQLPSGHVQSPPPPPPGTGDGGGTFGDTSGFRERWSISFAGCFVAGTPITLADGTTVPIERIGQGERLLATPSGRADTVAQVMFLSSDHVRELVFRLRGDASAETTTLRLTHDHRVWVDGRGWTFAAEVSVGDWLHGADGRLYEVTHNHRLPGRHDVYGLHMASDNVIYAAGVLTEDRCFNDTPHFSAPMGGAR
jgi:hypothetical protein